jgi:two-component system CheB/CheR fusion protein
MLQVYSIFQVALMMAHKETDATPTATGSPERKKDRSRNSRKLESRGGLIVGIGASAGGLEAFKAFFANVPADSELAFVLVQHLAPDHESMLAELLSRVTAVPVLDAVDGVRVEPRHVYVIPPNATLTIVDGFLQVRRPAPPREQRWPINTFFISLAQDQGDRAVCVVLAGTGSDGSKGLRAVKEHGGMALAQSGFDDEAMSGMPASAVATGLVDAVLPVAEMPARLLSYYQQMLASQGGKEADGMCGDSNDHLKTIFELVRAEVGHDFSQYKGKTLMRRIQRRMLVVQTETVSDYIAYLKQHASEHELLFREFLIGVTEFFRDPAAYEALRTIAIPSMLGDKGNADELRVWVPGCATGEEAYSIAIALREVMPDGRGPRVKIFATDIDEQAIGRARAGRFHGPLNGISVERLERWFHKDQDDYCVAKSIREMCIFSSHSVIKDPPFSRMDLVSCRNLLIYLNSELQERLLQSFHYALRPGGFLLLGPSERLGQNARLFNEMDQKQRLYIRREDVAAPVRHLPDTRRLRSHTRAPLVSSRQVDDLIDQHARHALEPWSPAYVIVNAKHEVLRFGGDTRRYLAPSSGTASLNLFQLLDKSLRSAVRTAVMQAFASGERVIRDGSQLLSSRERPLRLIVEPLPSPSEEEDNDKAKVELCVVAFHELEHAPRSATSETSDGAAKSAQTRIKTLEDELRGTRVQLHAAVDLHESASEDLKSFNEEYQSINEELQSANEELETSSEEMQSINEELQVVNNELHDKNRALNEVNNDFRNLLDSTHIATLFLNRELHIRSFTPAMTELFHLRDGDKGRPITEISPRMDYPELKDDVGRVLKQMTMTERVLSLSDDAGTFLMRMRPYVTIENVVDGVVLTFVDITESQHLNREHARLAAIVNSSRDAIIGLSLNDRITSWNPGAERIFGLPVGQAVGQALNRLVRPDLTPDAQEFFDSGGGRQLAREFEMTWMRPMGDSVPLSMNYAPVLSEGTNTLIAGQLIARDITEDHRARQHAEMMMGELNHRVKNTLATVQAIVMQTTSTATDLPGFKEDFLARLMALSQTHNLLARDAWKGVSLSDIVEQELNPWRQEKAEANKPRIRISGENLTLPPKQALALSMALHELTTNAVKYGALSEPKGRVVITWTTRAVGKDRWLALHWAEQNGPTVTAPKHRGFGSRLVRDGLAYELGGEVRLDFPPSGVICDIEFPLGETA